MIHLGLEPVFRKFLLQRNRNYSSEIGVGQIGLEDMNDVTFKISVFEEQIADRFLMLNTTRARNRQITGAEHKCIIYGPSSNPVSHMFM